MNEKNLISLAIISSICTCGLMVPVWIILLSIYFIVKAFRYKKESIPKPKTILPDNSFVADWVFEIRKVDV